jgi:hypothetical protein
MDYLPFECALVEGSSSVLSELSALPEEYSRGKSTGWEQNSYVLLAAKQLLYVMNSGSS